MGKNIVVITGSPRRNGNSFAMTDAFIRAAQEKGHTVTRFDAAFRKVGGCRACETCYRTGKACSRPPSWRRTRWSSPCRCIGTPFRRRSRA